MAKPRMRDTIEQLERTLRIEQEGIRERDAKIALLTMQLAYARCNERRLDQLIDGMCAGLKETNFPRRPN